MKTLHNFRRWLRSQGQRRAVKQEIDEELRFHLEQRTRKNIADGMSPDEAARAAKRSFGNVQRVREECREILGAAFGEATWMDFRFAFRQLGRNSSFTVIAVLTLAICIGASLAIFAVVDAILIRPLPFPDADRLVVIHNAYPGVGIERGNASIANYFERRQAIEALSSVSLFTEIPYIVGEAGLSRRVPAARVTPEFFRTLGVPLAMGREFTDEELDFKTDKVAIITDQFWRNHFNAVPDVLGRRFVMHTFQVTVIGVLPPDFRYLSSRAQVFRPFAHYRYRREPASRHSSDGQMVARLAPNRSIAHAQTQMDALIEDQLAGDPVRRAIEDSRHQVRIAPLHQDQVRAVKPILLLLQAGVLCLLLIGVVNVAGLGLIRASGRAKEFAIRQALGACRKRIAVSVLTETVLLALAGGALGVCFAALGIQLMDRLSLQTLPLGDRITLDGRIAGLAIVASVAVGICTALPILWSQLRGSRDIRLQSETRGGATHVSVQRLRHALVVTQVAIAFMLLCGAGSLGVSLKRILEKSPGFSAERVVSAELVLPWEHYPTNPSRLSFVRRLQEHLRALPGVTHAAVSTGLPFTADASLLKTIFPEGPVSESGGSLKAHYFSSVTPDYWKTMNIPLLQGRLIEESDSDDPPRVAVIDEALARQYWPDGNAIGRRFSTNPYDLYERKLFGAQTARFVENAACTVVGIVGSVKQGDLAEGGKRGAVYVPYTDSVKFQLVFRTSASVDSLAPVVEKVIRQIDAGLPLTDFKPLQGRMDESLITRRSPLFLAAAFAIIATLLAAIGIYGVLAYAVQLRRREVGVRMALGAMRSQIGRHFLRLGIKLSLMGVMLGYLGAWATKQAMQSILFEVTPLHLPVVVFVMVGITVVTLLASVLPAIRAARVSPMEAMKNE
jgi:predicted permease